MAAAVVYEYGAFVFVNCHDPGPLMARVVGSQTLQRAAQQDRAGWQRGQGGQGGGDSWASLPYPESE